MPINTDLNKSPYFDDFDVENQYYRVLFKPGFAVQARELIQLQSMLQNQVEQFGDNIFKEGSVIKGCNFTNLDSLQFVKINDALGGTDINPLAYIPKVEIETIGGIDVEIDYVYVLSNAAGLRAAIVQAANGFLADPVNKKTFFINYLNTIPGQEKFNKGDTLNITLFRYKRGTTDEVFAPSDVTPPTLSVISLPSDDAVGDSFGIQSAPGVIFQKGHFIFAGEQTLVVSKYNRVPDGVSVGYKITERNVNALEDAQLFDNANGSANENAPGADRLKLTPELIVVNSETGNSDVEFFSLIRYQNGNAVTIRDVSQYNVLGEEMARRTYEESGNYVLDNFDVISDDLVPSGSAAGTPASAHAVLGTGVAYVKGYRVENNAERSFPIDQITETETAANQAVSTAYGYYLDVTGFSGKIDLNRATVDIQDSGGSSIGSCQAINITPTKAYITNVVMVGAVQDIAKLSDGNGFVSVGNVIRNVGLKPLIFRTGLVSLFSTSDTLIPVRQQVSATAQTNVITITAGPGEDFVCDNNDVLVVAAGGAYPTINSTTTQTNNSELVIELDSSGGPWSSVEVYYNVRLIGSTDGVEPYGKVVEEPFVRVDHTLGQNKYSLGFPDVFEIISIEDTLGTDYTKSFKLHNNQKDTHYDISYIEYIQGRPRPGNQRLIIQLKCFKVISSSGDYYFTINSYPNTLERYEIPSYTSESGQVYNLRDCFDFRPHVDKISNANYTATIPAQAPTITTTVGTQPITFATAPNPLIPAAQQSLQTDLEHYLSRIDTIACDSYGDIILIKGEEQKNAIPPKLETDQLAIANVEIPTFPALSKKQSDILNKSAYSIKPRATGIKNYTMKDMHQLEKKIDNMAYYISLNQLESETSNMVIRDENGLNRFKNGFVVDPFNNLELSEVQHPQFNAAVPFNKKILTPSLKTFALDLKYDSATGSSVFPSTADAKVATIGRNSNVDIINQPYASNFRNCVSNFYKYVGDGVISPPYDAAYDTTVNPASIDIDLTTPFQEFIDEIQSFLPMTDTSSSRGSSRCHGCHDI